MKLLIAEDDVFFRKLLQKVLSQDHECVAVEDGNEAWAALQQSGAPRLAILDWVMPGVSGPDLCRRIRQTKALSSMYLILLTAKNSGADIVAGLRAGADDYVTKPFVPEELRARVKVGENILSLQDALAAQLVAANDAFTQIKQLHDLLLGVPCRQRAPSRQVWQGSDGHLLQKVDVQDQNCQGCRLTGNHSQLQLTAGSRRPPRV